jgi:hypothetical protein
MSQVNPSTGPSRAYEGLCNFMQADPMVPAEIKEGLRYLVGETLPSHFVYNSELSIRSPTRSGFVLAAAPSGGRHGIRSRLALALRRDSKAHMR